MDSPANKHPITPDILRLIRQAIDDSRGSKAAFCRRSGISPYNLSKILSGNKKYVYGDLWHRLCEEFAEIDDRPCVVKLDDPLLQFIVDRWNNLSSEEQARVVGFVRDILNAKSNAAAGAGGSGAKIG